MASGNKILSDSKAKEKLKGYLASVEAEYDELRRDDAQSRSNLSAAQARRVALYDGLVAEDILVIVEDDYLLAEWERLHVEYAQALLRTILRDLNLDPKVSERIESHKQQLLIALQEVDQSVPSSIPDEELESFVKGVKHVLNETPGLAARVLDDLPAELKKEFGERCKEIRMQIRLVEQRAKAEALSDLEKRRLSPAEWHLLADQLEIIEIPKIAQTRKHDFEVLQNELTQAQAENQYLTSELSLTTQVKEAEASELRVDLRIAQRELKEEKEKTVEADNKLTELQQKAVEELNEQREESRKEVAAVREDLANALQSQKNAESLLRTAKSDHKGAQDLAEKQHKHEISVLTKKHDAELATANENAVQDVQTVQKSSAELLAKAQQDKPQIDKELSEAQTSLVTAEAELVGIEEKLTEEQNARVKAEADVIRLVNESSAEGQQRQKAEKALKQEQMNAHAAHEQAEKVIGELRSSLNAVKADLDKSQVEAEGLKQAISDRQKAEGELRTEIRISGYMKQALDESQERAAARYEGHRAALKAQQELVKAEKDAHEKTKQALEEQNNKLELQLQNAKQEKETLDNSISKLNAVANAYKSKAKREQTALKDDAERERTAQAQAVNALTDFMSGVSLVKAPRAEQLRSLHKSCQDSSSSTSLPALPAIIVATGRLPAAWSYLSFASRGVLMDSRFNGAITSAAAFDLPWVLDTLDRVVKAVIASEEAVPVVVLIVLLQGIAYVHLAIKLSSDEITWSPKPRELLEPLAALLPNDPESVLGSVHKRVYDLVTYEVQVDSWISMDEFKGERFDSSNTALPEGVVMIPEEVKCQVFMIRSTGDGERLFIIDEQTVVMKPGKVPHTTIWLPPVNGLDLRRMALTDDEHWREPRRWAQRLEEHSS